MGKCGANGCSLPTSSTHLDCEALCNATAGCVAYVFSNAGCDVPSGSNVLLVAIFSHKVCWLKNGVGDSNAKQCRNYRIVKAVSLPFLC
jgi:hypothetical protein